MMLETACTIMFGYICLVIKVNAVFKSKIFNTISEILPKVTGVLIFTYLILKYVFKLEG